MTPWTAARQASLSITISQSLLKLMSIEFEMPSNNHVLCQPLLLLPSTFPSIRVFSNESVLRIKWPKNWSFSFIIRPSNKYSGLISFKIDYLLGMFSSVQSLSRVPLFVTPWTAACQASLSPTISQSLLKLMSFESVMPSNHLILCHPLLLLPSTFPASGSFLMSQLFASMAKVLEFQLHYQSFQ